MNKKEAAEFLGCSERAINRYITKQQISVKYVQGRNGKEAVFDEDELQRFKDERGETYAARPAVVKDTHDTLAIDTVDSQQKGAMLEILSTFAESQKRIAALLEGAGISKQLHTSAPIVPVSERLTLTLDEASSLSGLSRGFLLVAIKGKKLKAAKRGRGWNIKRDDLQTFIKKL